MLAIIMGQCYGILGSDLCGQYCRVWNTSAKLVHNVPRSCHTYLVEKVLAPEFLPTKVGLMSRFAKFFRSVSESPSLEISVLAKIVYSDVRSTTSKNMLFIKRETGLDPFYVSMQDISNSVKPAEVPKNDEWRIEYLKKLLQERRELEVVLEDTKIISLLIDSLCSS